MQHDSWQERPHNVPRHPQSDINNADQPSSVDLDEKRELIKARRRAAYRKKKEEATVKQQDKVLVYKVVDGKAVSTLITVADVDDGRTYIVTGGLTVGDEIVAKGAGLIREGMQIK